MPNRLKEKIKNDNRLINFLKIPEELIEGKYNLKNLDDVDRKIAFYLSEEYTKEYYHSKFKSILKDIFYLVKPVIPRHIQIKLRKKYLTFQKKLTFPSWPIDLSLYDIYRNGIREILKLTGLPELPFIRFWPNDKKFAVVLTHDVETENGQENIWRVKEIEEELGFRSSWNFVPEKYKLDEQLITELINNGFEIGIHGLKHDGKLFRNKKVFLKRVQQINYYIEKYNCLGFRSPMTWRNYKWMQRLNIKYDLSFFDNDIFEGQPGGTLSFHPFILGEFVELPYTLPQDHTLFFLLDEEDDKIWENKMKIIKQFHGMVLMITHPDYLIKKDLLTIYREFLIKLKNELGYWHALPKEVARWWSCRVNRSLKLINGQWEIYPPLDGASIGTINMDKKEFYFN